MVTRNSHTYHLEFGFDIMLINKHTESKFNLIILMNVFIRR